MRTRSKTLPSYVAELLEAERQAPRPSAQIEGRVRGRVAATVLASAAGATSLAASSAAAATAAGVSAKVGGIALGVKLSVLVVGVGVMGTAGGIVWRHSVVTKARPVAANHHVSHPIGPGRKGTQAKPTVEVPRAATEMPHEARVETPPVPADTHTTPIVPPTNLAHKAVGHPRVEVLEAEVGENASRLAEESPLIDRARAALEGRQPELTLAILGQHARRFPHGQLEQEREALGVQALVATGDVAGARARAEKFSRRFPRSIQLDIVEAAVAPIK